MKLTVNGVEIPGAQEGVYVRLEASDGEEMGPIDVRFEHQGTFKVKGRFDVNKGAGCYLYFSPQPNLLIFEGNGLRGLEYGGAAKEFEEGTVPITRTETIQ